MYLDTGIIVKLLVEEPDSGFFKSATIGKLVSTSELTITELKAALFSKERAQAITAPQRIAAWEEFSTWMEDERITIHPFDHDILLRARNTLDRCHPAVALRTLDSIHVAACDQSQDYPLCATDKRMREAAKMLFIPVFPE